MKTFGSFHLKQGFGRRVYTVDVDIDIERGMTDKDLTNNSCHMGFTIDGGEPMG